MSTVEARPVDPRDARWELWAPAYRVYFWGPWPGGGVASREFELAASDVGSVLAWAERNARVDETYTVYVVVGTGGDLGIVRLAGDDPTRGASTPSG